MIYYYHSAMCSRLNYRVNCVPFLTTLLVHMKSTNKRAANVIASSSKGGHKEEVINTIIVI